MSLCQHDNILSHCEECREAKRESLQRNFVFAQRDRYKRERDALAEVLRLISSAKTSHFRTWQMQVLSTIKD